MFAKYVSNDIHLNIFFSYTYGIRAFSIAGQDKCSELTKKVDLLRHSSQILDGWNKFSPGKENLLPWRGWRYLSLVTWRAKLGNVPWDAFHHPVVSPYTGNDVCESLGWGGYHPSGIWVWITWGPWLITRMSNYRAVAMLCPKHHAPFQSE